MCDHIAALQKGYSAKEELKGKGISQITQLKRLLFGKTPEHPKQAAL